MAGVNDIKKAKVSTVNADASTGSSNVTDDAIFGDLIAKAEAGGINRPAQATMDEAKNALNTAQLKEVSAGVFTFIMRGEYYSQSSIGTAVKQFRDVVCKLHKNALQMAMTYIQNIILPPLLKRQFSDFTGLRTSHIQKVETPNPEDAMLLPLDLMDRDMLTMFINRHELPINVSLYPRAIELKRAILDYRDNPEKFTEASTVQTKRTLLFTTLAHLNDLGEEE